MRKLPRYVKILDWTMAALVAWFLALSLVFVLASPGNAQRLTATQSLAVEYAPQDGEWTAIGTLVLDLALGPRNHLTYIHDRAWEPGGWHQAHDMSATRYFAGDISVSAGVRLKIPEDGPHRHVWYGVVAWPWGD